MPDRLYQRCNEPSCCTRTNNVGGYCEEHLKSNQRTRQQSDRGHAFYKLAIWQRVKEGFRMKYPERAFVCQWRDPETDVMCGRPAKIIHHLIPFRGDWDLFLGGIDYENLAGICQAHHNIETAKEQQDIEEEEV